MIEIHRTAVLIFAAFCAGGVDAIAGGGGLITVPALLATGLPPHLAIGTNKGQAVFGTFASTFAFWRRGMLDRDRIPLAMCFGFLGSCVGATLLLRIPPEPLKPIVLGLLAIAGLIVLLRPNTKRTLAQQRTKLLLIPIALLLGAYDGFLGPGVGAMLIVSFAYFFGDEMLRASGNAKIVNLSSNLAAIFLFSWRGTVLWPTAVTMAMANMLGATVGAQLAIRIGGRFVRMIVLVMVCAVMVQLAVQLWGK